MIKFMSGKSGGKSQGTSGGNQRGSGETKRRESGTYNENENFGVWGNINKLYVPVLALLLLFSGIFYPGAAFAEAEAVGAALPKTGLYVTPYLGWTSIKLTNAQITMANVSEDVEGDWSATNLAFGLAGGYDFAKHDAVPLRIEGAFTFRPGMSDKDEDSGSSIDMNSFITAMLNGWIDFPIEGSMIKPYIGAGLGLMAVGYDIEMYTSLLESKASGTASTIAFNLGLGVEVPINDMVSIDAGYRYTQGSGLSADILEYAGETMEMEWKNVFHDVLVGMRLKF